MTIKFNSPQDTIGWVGNGALLIAELDDNDRPIGGYRNLGQVSSAVVSLTSEKIELADTMNGTLATAQSLVVRNTAELTATLKSFSPENLALALFGETVADAKQTSATHSFAVETGRLEVVPGIIEGNFSIVLDSDGTDVTENFVVNSGSVFTPVDQSAFAQPLIDGDSVTITYDKAEIKRIEGFIDSTKNVSIVFDGFNIANRDKAVKVTYHKVALDPAAQRQLISTDFADQELKGTLLSSNAITASGLSKLFKEEHQQ